MQREMIKQMKKDSDTTWQQRAQRFEQFKPDRQDTKPSEWYILLASIRLAYHELIGRISGGYHKLAGWVSVGYYKLIGWAFGGEALKEDVDEVEMIEVVTSEGEMIEEVTSEGNL